MKQLPGHVVRAEQARAEAMIRKLPRRANNPFSTPEPLGRTGGTYLDRTADQAIGNVMREQRDQR